MIMMHIRFHMQYGYSRYGGHMIYGYMADRLW
jgi:hypothetical protein